MACWLRSECFLMIMLIKKSVKNFIVVFVVLVLLAGVIFASTKREPNNQDDFSNMSLREYILSSFINELPEINSKLPFQIDADTVLLSIEYVTVWCCLDIRCLTIKLLPSLTRNSFKKWCLSSKNRHVWMKSKRTL